MFIIFYKDGHQEHTYNKTDIELLDWSDVIMVIHMNNVDN